MTVLGGGARARLVVPTEAAGEVVVVVDTPPPIVVVVDPLGIPGPAGPPGDQTIGPGHTEWRPTSAIRETVSRYTALANGALLVSGTIACVGIWLPAGVSVASVSFFSGPTAAVAPTNQWVGLFDENRNRLATSNNLTTSAWGGNALKAFPFATPYPVTVAGRYYLGLLVTATTPPTIMCIGHGAAPGSIFNLIAPAVSGFGNAGLTTPATCPATLAPFTGTALIPWALVA